MGNLFYVLASGQVYYADQLQQNTGFAPTADPSYLAANGIYTVNQTANPCDPYLYTSTANYTVVGNYADQSWTCTAYPLATAQAGGEYQVKVAATAETSGIIAANSVSSDVMTAVAGQDPLARPASLQTILDEMQVVSDLLGAQITAINAATTVDEINNIVNPPTGILNTGRGSGLGPEDLNLSYYTEFNSVSLTEADTELYIPGTATVIPYDSLLPPPYIFDSMGNCFNPGDYLMQIRETATSRVIAEFECPLNPSNEDVAF